MKKERRKLILTSSHEELYDSVKTATAAKTKVDLLADFLFKVVCNDIKCIEEDVKDLQKAVWKIVGIIVAVEFIVTAGINIAIKVFF